MDGAYNRGTRKHDSLETRLWGCHGRENSAWTRLSVSAMQRCCGRLQTGAKRECPVPVCEISDSEEDGEYGMAEREEEAERTGLEGGGGETAAVPDAVLPFEAFQAAVAQAEGPTQHAGKRRNMGRKKAKTK